MSGHVCFAFPSHTGQAWIPTFTALFMALPSLMEAGWRMSMDPLFFDYTESARGKLMGNFLKSDATDLLFIDYDNFWHDPKAVLRILSHDVAVVGADYPRKRIPINFLSLPLPGPSKVEANGLIEREGVPAGFLRIRRDAALRMASEWPPDKNGEYPFFYRLRHENGELLGDDYSFCARWRQLGGKVWLDPEIRVSHIGTMTYDAPLKEWLKAQDEARG